MEQDMAKILFVTAIFLLLHTASSQSLKTHGEQCDSDCDERQGLSCTGGQCTCMLQNSTIYDSARSHCVIKAGHTCRRIIQLSSNTSLDTLCVPNASCPSLNLPCECNKFHFAQRNGSCALMASYREQCSGKRPCDKSSGMECIGSKSKQYSCLCKYPRDQYYDPILKSCIAYPGGGCLTEKFTLPCVKNANCSQEMFELKRGETLGRTYFYNATVSKQCGCLPGFSTTKESRECLPSYKTPCDYYDDNYNHVCNSEENLKCFDNKICLCQNPLHQQYSKERGKCLNLVGTKCSTEDCVEGAECLGVCKCKTGLTPTPSRYCGVDFGETCDRDGKRLCNFYRGLSCQNGTCNCLDDFLMYSSSLKTCVSSKGSPCGDFLWRDDGGGLVQILEATEDTNANQGKKLRIKCADGFRCLDIEGYYECA